MLAVLLPLAAQASHVSSGAVLTLVLPLGCALIALAIWWYLATRSGRARKRTEAPVAEPGPAPGPAPE
jgi:hypothetical protein